MRRRRFINVAAHALFTLPFIIVATSISSTTTIQLTQTVFLGTSTTTISGDVAGTTTVQSAISTGTIHLRPSSISSLISSVTTSQQPFPSSSFMPGDGFHGVPFHAAVLNSTNYFRAQHQAQNLTWDSSLAAYAQQHARKCIWEHSGGPYGENLAEGFQTSALAIDAWAAEESQYNYAKRGFSEQTGHYTQLIWRNTTRVGCAATRCDNFAANGAHGWFLVCEYRPPGNVEGQYGYNVRKPGEAVDGTPGFGGAMKRSGVSSLLAVLVTASLLAGFLME